MGERPNQAYAIGAHRELGHDGKPAWRPWIRIRGKVGVELCDALPSNKWAAYIFAADRLLDALNGRTKSRRKHGYERITGADLSAALHDFDMTPTEFAILYGTTLDRVLMWIDNADTIPHPVRVMLAMFEVPGALERAREETRAATGQDEEEDLNA